MTINTKEDLNAVAGTSEYERFMASLRGSLFNVYKENDKWFATENNDVIERFGLTRADFDPIEQPVLPINETAEKIAANQMAANRKALKAVREASLKAITHTLEDGSAVQVRPDDLGTLNLAIAAGQSEDWVLADDTVRTLTVEEMQEALLSGIEQGKIIWRVYTEELKQL